MNIKNNLLVIGALLILLLSVSFVSASENNTDIISSAAQTDYILSVDVEDNISASNIEDNEISISSEENITNTEAIALSSSAEDTLSASNVENDTLSACAEDNLSAPAIVEKPLSTCVNVDNTLTATNNESKLAISISSDDAVLTSIYDKVYSHKNWKSVKLTSFKVKKSLPKYKRDKIINKHYKKACKKINKNVRKYQSKGWCYERCLWTWQVGSTYVYYQYYVQFSKTVYYNGYGKRIA